MSNLRILFSSVLLALSLGFSASVTLVNAYSETFPLVESASVSRIVYAIAGQKIVGDFTVSNIPTWNDAYTGDPQTVQYAFIIVKIEGTEFSSQDIELFRATQIEHSSFDVNCDWTGNYRLRFNVGRGQPIGQSGYPTLGIGDMKATLNYNVVDPSSSGSTDNQSSSEPVQISQEMILGLFGLVIILVVLGVSLYVRKRYMTQNTSKKRSNQ